MNLTKNGKVFTSKSVGTGPSSYEQRMYRAAVSQSFRNTGLEDHRSEPWQQTLPYVAFKSVSFLCSDNGPAPPLLPADTMQQFILAS